jgi:hypothetical protein
MKRFRAVARQSPAIVISLIALTFSLGSGAGYAASVATHHPTAKVSWHSLKLLHGWHRFAVGLGAPSYTVIGGVVYLAGAGAVSGTENPPPVLAVLPKGARPKHDLELAAFSSAADTPAAVYIYSNGDIVAEGANASYQTSLAGISFPAGE